MEVKPEDVPSQIKDVLGMLADYGALKDNSQKRPKRTLPWDQPSRRHLPDNDNETLPKMMSLLCQLVLRHDRDLNSLHHQNTYILFLSTGPDSLMLQMLQASAQWKQQPGQPIPEAMSDPDIGTNLVATCKQGEGVQEGRPSMDLKLAEQTDPPRCLVAVSQMGSLQEGVGLGWQVGEHPHERDDPALGALRDAGKVRGNHSISCSAEQEQASTSYSLEAGTRHEGSPTSCIDGLLGAQQCLATDSGQIETSSSATVQDGRRTLEAHQEEVDRHKWCMALSAIHLVNDDVQCFVNAVYLTVMWTHLMCCDFNMGSWGLVTTAFLDTLTDGIDSPLCLRSHPRLQAGFAQWQQLRGEMPPYSRTIANSCTISWGGSAANMLHRP